MSSPFGKNKRVGLANLFAERLVNPLRLSVHEPNIYTWNRPEIDPEIGLDRLN